MSDSSEEKKHEPSASKLRKLRRDGSVPQTNEALFFAGRAFVLAVLVVITVPVTGVLMGSFTRFAEVFQLPFVDASQIMMQDLQHVITFLYSGVLIGPSVFAVVISILMNSGFIFSFKSMSPNFGKLNPAEGFKRIFGLRGWAETGAGFVRITIWLVYALLVLLLSFRDFFLHWHCGANCLFQEALALLIMIVGPFILILAFVTAIEIMIQRILFAHEQKMTDTEVKQESKENFGNPELRSERKRLARESQQGDAQFIKGYYVDYVLWDGHILIGISYEPPKQPLPRVVMRVTDKQTSDEEYVELKKEGIPFYKSKSLVAAMMRVPLGEPVPEKTFAEVAQAIATMSQRR